MDRMFLSNNYIPNELDRNIIFEIEAKIDRSECEGRQNARLRVRFDKIFAYFSSIGKVRASPA